VLKSGEFSQYKPSFHSQEEFIFVLPIYFFRITNNCSGGGVPTPTPPPVPPTSCPAVTGQCGPSRTCASIGFPGHCCSQYGWCGTSAAHCGTCCQNGCTGTTSSLLGDWAQCSKNSQCRNGCCSGMYSGGVLKCTPLSGGVFNPSICTAV